MREMRCIYIILVGKDEETRSAVAVGVYERLILK
jgi:hypothetical protein